MVSIIVPVYNAELYIDRMIQSVLCQTRTDWELILVDDGSKDESLHICKLYQSKDSRIKPIHQDNLGVASARNTGLRNASGDFVVFGDADDYFETDYLARFEEAFQAAGSDCFIFGLFVDYSDVVSRVHTPPIDCEDRLHGIDEMIRSWFDIYWMGVWNKVYKKSIIQDNRILFRNDISYDEDSLFNLSYFHYCKNVFCSEMPVYHYVQQNALSLTRSFSHDRLNSLDYVEDQLLDLARINGVETDPVENMCVERKMDIAYSQLCMLMNTENDSQYKKKYTKELKNQLKLLKHQKQIRKELRYQILFWPYWMISLFFGMKRIRKCIKM